MTFWNYVCLSKPKSEIKYLPNKICLIIIHANATHILDMPCYHQDQQQRYRNENTKICMFIHYMYVDMLLSLTKGHFNYIWTSYQTLPSSRNMKRPWCNALPKLFGQDSFPLKMSLFQVSLLQNPTNCLLNNGCAWILLPLLIFTKKFSISSRKRFVCSKIFLFCQTDSFGGFPWLFFHNQ